MLRRTSLILIVSAMVTSGLFSQSTKYKVSSQKDKNGYAYETITNDPLQARIYTLQNGLKVFLTYHPDEPRIQTLIGVRAGSAHDPVETTGLAHYFEHMMFKGTNKIGTSNWESEKVLLDQISDLFEIHRRTTDPGQKREIYHRIDSLSVLAAQFAIPNEYDKMISSLGAKNTNAGTSLDYTVYINDIPSNEFERWVMLESERFQNIVLRLFHTELETVYEEFNMYQDQDRRRANSAMMGALFQNHPYGRSVIGLPEHLKNPSMVNIYRFAETYYQPNNMAISISGDIDFERYIQIIDRYFGKMKPSTLPKISYEPENPITSPIIKEVTGPDAENISLAFRFQGDNSADHRFVTLIDAILSNQKAGLIDLNLNQQQKVLRAGSYSYFLKDYGMLVLSGMPRQGQKLEEVRDLLLTEIEKIKKGEFEEWLLQAIINDMRLSEIRQLERNYSRANKYLDAFFKSVPYQEKLAFIDELEKITRQQLIDYARSNFKDNYVVVYKRQGEPQGIVKVDKPSITAIEINREKQSEFQQAFLEMPSGKLDPVFVDFQQEIKQKSWKPGIELSYIQNKANELFSLNYIIDMGRNHDPKLALAIDYLPFLGTDNYTAAQFQQELYRHGLSFSVRSGDDRCYVTISGLEKSLEKGIELLEHMLTQVQPDALAYKNLVDGIQKDRTNAKANKNTILWRAMFNYGKYGHANPFTHIIPETELRNINPLELTNLIKGMTSYQHKIFYYGSSAPASLEALLDKYHKPSLPLKPVPARMDFHQQPTDQNQVLLVDYDMVQANIILLSKGSQFEEHLIPPATLFGEYFGSGLSSIVFQEIRESKGLAYSAFSSFAIPSRADEANYLYAFVGTQPDKMATAIGAMMGLMNDMPRAERQFELAKEGIQKKIETERIIKSDIFWTYQRYLDQGIDRDIRKDVYEMMKHITLESFSEFFNEHISNKHFTLLIMGKKADMDQEWLKGFGQVRELSLTEIFGY